MASLLTLPKELQDQIIELVLLWQRPLPEDTTLSRLSRSKGERTGNADLMLAKEEARSLNYYHPSRSNIAALTLVCKDLSVQCRCVISRLFVGSKPLSNAPSTGISYTADLLIAYERDAIFSWTNVPFLSDHIEQLTVNVRHYGSQFESGWHTGFRGRHTKPSEWPTSELFRFLSQTLAYGPGTPDRAYRPIPRSNIRIAELIINFISPKVASPPEGWPKRFSAWESHRDGSRNWRADAMIRAPLLCAAIRAKTIGLLRKQQTLGGPPLGSLIFERVGRIRFCVDGRQHFLLEPRDEVARVQDRTLWSSRTSDEHETICRRAALLLGTRALRGLEDL